MYVLHSLPDSAALMVRLVLEELGQPYEDRRIDRAGGQLSSPAYLAMQPLGKVPALETPDGAMFEVAAILLWLSERHGALAPAPGDPARAAFLKWYFFATFNVHPTLLQVFYPEREAGPDSAPQVVQTAAAKLHRYLAILDAMVRDETPAWLSAAPSILGYYLGVLVRWLTGFSPDHPAHVSLAEYPALERILTALERRPAALRAAAVDGLGPALFTRKVA